MRRGAEIFRFRVFGVAESQRAYVKIEVLILALARAGRYPTFVLFAANIPRVVEPFGAGALAGKYPVAGAASFFQEQISFSDPVPGTICRSETRTFHGKWSRRAFRQCGSRIRANCEDDFLRGAQKKIFCGHHWGRRGVLRFRIPWP